MSKSNRIATKSKKKEDSHQDVADTASQNAASKDSPVNDSGIGAELKRLRSEKGLSREDIFNVINIPVTSLAAFENERFEELPADIFVRGQLIIYGNLLGIDGKETAKLFLEARTQQLPKRRARSDKNNHNEQQHSLAAKKLAEPAHVSSATVALILFLILAVFVTSFCLYTGWNPFAYFLNKEESAISLFSNEITDIGDTESVSIKPALTAADSTFNNIAPAAIPIVHSARQETEDNLRDNDSQSDRATPPAAQQNKPGD